MKIVFFGLGSIGRRHAGILKQYPEHEIFAYRSAKNGKGNDLGLKEIYSWEEVEKIRPDTAFITNPTFMHIDTALKCAGLNTALFIEKPIGSSTEKLALLEEKIEKRGLTSYVAYNLRFNPVIEYLKKNLSLERTRHVSVYNSSFLPDWRKNRNHLETYSALKDEGGGVILDLSHEFDYIDYLFGPIQDIKGVFGKAGNVTVDSEDFLDAVIRTENTYINLHSDFLSLHTERTIKIDCDDEYIFADLISGRIEFYGKDEKIRIEHFEINQDSIYEKQIEYFLKNIANRNMMNNIFEAARLFKKLIHFKEQNT